MIVIKALIRFLLAILVVIMLALSFLLTPYGFQATLFMVKRIVPSQIHYQTINGLLIGPITITHLDYAYKKQHIHINHLEFNWSPINLLRGELTINHLIANGVTIIGPKNNDTHSSNILDDIKPFKPTPLHLPFLLKINQAQLTNITYGAAGTPLTTIKVMDVNGVINPNNMAFSTYILLVKPQPLEIQFSLMGDINNYKIAARINNNSNRLTLNGFGNQNGITLIVPEDNLAGGHLNAHAALTWFPTMSCNASWEVNIPDLSKIYKEAQGSIVSQGNVQGDLNAPETTGTLNFKNVIMGNLNDDSLQLNWSLLFDADSLSTLRMTAHNLSYKGHTLSDTQIDISGQLKDRIINSVLNFNQNKVLVKANVHYANASWQGAVTQLDVADDTFGQWTLKQDTPFTYTSASQFYLKPLCITATTGASLCTQLTQKPKNPWHFSFVGQDIRLTNISHDIASKAQFTGALAINANAIGLGSTVQKAEFTSDLTPGVLTYSINDQFKNVALRASHLTLIADQKNGLKGTAILAVEKNDSITGSITMPQLLDNTIALGNKKIAAQLTLNMKNLQWVFLIESVLKVSLDEVSGQLSLDGTLGHPNLHGNTIIKASKFEYTTAQMFLHNITATIKASNNKLLYQLTGAAFNNSIANVTGNTTLAFPNVSTQLILKTNNAEVTKNNQFDLFATSTVTFLFDPNHLAINGDILIPKALLQPVEFSNTLLMPKESVVYIGLPASAQIVDTYRRIINLNITLGNDVRINAYNMKASLLGKLNLTMSAEKTTLANGRIEIGEGTFQAYGKTLKIAPGSSISFTHSPIGNPTINAHAFKMIDSNSEVVGTQSFINNILVGVYVHGTLSNLQISLYSQPPNISQSDILSYLVLGYASSGVNTSSLSNLITAASTASTASGGLQSKTSNFLNEFKQALGIQDGDIGTRNETILDAIGNPVETQSSFVVGHLISKKIYVEYSRGTIYPDNTVSVSYHINKNWSVQTSAGTGPLTGTGGDVIYSFTRN